MDTGAIFRHLYWSLWPSSE